MTGQLPTKSRFTLFAVALAAAALLGVVAAAVELWNEVGDSEISLAGWIAAGFGVLAALGLGIGLMSLVFFSRRRGYDELAGRDR